MSVHFFSCSFLHGTSVLVVTAYYILPTRLSPLGPLGVLGYQHKQPFPTAVSVGELNILYVWFPSLCLYFCK